MMPTAHKGNKKGNPPRRAPRASSLNGLLSEQAMVEPVPRIRRPQTLPDLRNGRSLMRTGPFPDGTTKKVQVQPSKILFNATVQGSTGPVQLLVPQDASVGDLIDMALRQYAKEGRRPVIVPGLRKYELHYSSFNLESLDEDEKLSNLGARNFFLCPKKESTGNLVIKEVTTSLKSKDLDDGYKIGTESLIKFADYSKLFFSLLLSAPPDLSI